MRMTQTAALCTALSLSALVSCKDNASVYHRLQSGDSLRDLNGQRIEVNGKALNAKEGALVECEPLGPFFLDFEAWPEHAYGKYVRVFGRLHYEDIQRPNVNEEGLVVAGGSAQRWRIQESKWELAE
jgi:hypothetical protein